ncbi:hypothetical protein, partial [Pseudomonas mediterranea]|uniref:hypothetical protein n=1 Tax=Pseudomonas mediterranea TaxID=183795 RepID=UPI001E641B28
STALAAAVNTSFSPLSTEKIEPSTGPNNAPYRLLPDLDELKSCTARKTSNSLKLKEFSV